MNIKKLTTALVALALFVLPVVSLANTYQYADTAGRLQTVEANSSTEALVKAPNIGSHSGVMLLTSGGIVASYNPPTNNTSIFAESSILASE
jgi:hypothetical protein